MNWGLDTPVPVHFLTLLPTDLEKDRAMGRSAEPPKNMLTLSPTRSPSFVRVSLLLTVPVKLSLSSLPEAYLRPPSPQASPEPYRQDAASCPLEEEEDLDKWT